MICSIQVGLSDTTKEGLSTILNEEMIHHP